MFSMFSDKHRCMKCGHISPGSIHCPNCGEGFSKSRVPSTNAPRPIRGGSLSGGEALRIMLMNLLLLGAGVAFFIGAVSSSPANSGDGSGAFVIAGILVILAFFAGRN